MDLKFKEFAKIIFVAESAGILENFSNNEPNLKAMFIEWMESPEEERAGFIQAKIEAMEEWHTAVGDLIKEVKGDK